MNCYITHISRHVQHLNICYFNSYLIADTTGHRVTHKTSHKSSAWPSIINLVVFFIQPSLFEFFFLSVVIKIFFTFFHYSKMIITNSVLFVLVEFYDLS